MNRATLLLLGAALVAIVWAGTVRNAASDKPLGLFTSLPILWNEGADLSAELDGSVAPHWARQVLPRLGRLVPLDLLTAGSLARTERLIVAQPRALAPDENVALDDWVRQGGQLLLFADPALTVESSLPISDPRRPQAAVMLSPILTRWGLDLRFDEAQPLGEEQRDVQGAAVPVNLPGQFALLPGSTCRLSSAGLAADCRVGKGRVVAIADAALLDPQDPDGSRSTALTKLIEAVLQ